MFNGKLFIKEQKLLILVVQVLTGCEVLLPTVRPYLLWLAVCLLMLDTFLLDTCLIVSITCKTLLEGRCCWYQAASPYSIVLKSTAIKPDGFKESCHIFRSGRPVCMCVCVAKLSVSSEPMQSQPPPSNQASFSCCSRAINGRSSRNILHPKVHQDTKTSVAAAAPSPHLLHDAVPNIVFSSARVNHFFTCSKHRYAILHPATGSHGQQSDGTTAS